MIELISMNGGFCWQRSRGPCSAVNTVPNADKPFGIQNSLESFPKISIEDGIYYGVANSIGDHANLWPLLGFEAKLPDVIV